MYAAGLNDADAIENGRRFLSRVTDVNYIADAGQQVTNLESAARMGLVLAPHMTWAAHDAAARPSPGAPRWRSLKEAASGPCPPTGPTSACGSCPSIRTGMPTAGQRQPRSGRQRQSGRRGPGGGLYPSPTMSARAVVPCRRRSRQGRGRNQQDRRRPSISGVSELTPVGRGAVSGLPRT